MIKFLLNKIKNNNLPSNSSQRAHFNYLDSLRGLAALFVLLHHVWEGQIGYGTHLGMYGLLTNWMLYGHLAVDVFIVLSGFCLMLPVAKSGGIDGGFLKFYIKRSRRILPPFYVCLGISTLIYLASVKIGQVHHSPLSFKMMFANLLLMQDAFPYLNKINQPLWSVAVECKIYILFPIIVWIYFRYKIIVLLASAGIVGYGIWGYIYSVNPHLVLSQTCPWYLLLFAMGVCAGAAVNDALPVKINVMRIQCFIYLLLSIFVLKLYPITEAGEGEYFVPHLPLIDAVVGAFATSAIVIIHNQHVAHHNTALIRFLSWSPLVWVGRFAYSIYLMHIPFLIIITAVVKRIGVIRETHFLNDLIVFSVGIPMTVFLCYIFYVVFELPFVSKSNNKFQK